MKHAIENTLSAGSIALGLGLMLTTLCQAQQWSSEQNLQGTLLSNPAPAQMPGTNVPQVFYHGGDNGMWTRWRNTDGTWSQEQSLGEQRWYPPPRTGGCDSVGDPCVWSGSWAVPAPVQIPNTNYLEVFYRGSDSGAQIVGTDLFFGLAMSSVGGGIQTTSGHYVAALVWKLISGGVAGVLAGANLSAILPSRLLRVGLSIWIIALGAQFCWRGLVS